MSAGSRPLACLLPLVLAAAVAAGCGSSVSSQPPQPGAVKVVATTTQVGDLARAVGGARAQVVQLLRPNSDPHEYEPRPDDVRALVDAPLVLASGDGLDAWIGKLVDDAGGDPRVVTLADANVARASGDPHWWHDPRNVAAAIPLVRDALARANPSAAGVYARNARVYLARVRRLDAGIAACMRRVPTARRK